MKNRISLVLSVGLIVPLLFAGAVLAVDEPATEPKVAQNQTTAEERNAKLKERLDKRKAELKVKLSAIQEKRVQTRCKNSQTFTTKISTRATNIEANRSQKHSTVVDRLTTLQNKLEAKNIDSAGLPAQITELKAKIAVFNTDWAAYKEAVADVSEMDCVADPNAFKASLESARASLKKVRADSADIKAYIKTTIKPTLQTIRVQVQQQSSNGGNN